MLCKGGSRGLDIFTFQRERSPRSMGPEAPLHLSRQIRAAQRHQANPRSTTAPGLNSSFQDMSPLALAKRFMLIASSLQRVVENDPDRMAVPGADTTDPVSQIDPIDPTRPLHRTVMDGESHRVALP